MLSEKGASMANTTYKGVEITKEQAAELSVSLKQQMGEKQYKKLMGLAKTLNTFGISKKILTKAVAENPNAKKVEVAQGLSVDDMSDMIELLCVLAQYGY